MDRGRRWASRAAAAAENSLLRVRRLLRRYRQGLYTDPFRRAVLRVSPGAATAGANWSEVAGSGANGSVPGAPIVMVTPRRQRWWEAAAAAAAALSSVYARRRRRRAPVSPVGSTNLTRWPAGQFTPIWDRGRQVFERSKIRNDRRRRRLCAPFSRYTVPARYLSARVGFADFFFSLVHRHCFRCQKCRKKKTEQIKPIRP